MKRRRFAKGDILEVVSPRGKKQNVIVLRNDEFGLLIRLSVDPHGDIAYVNPKSVNWPVVGHSDDPKLIEASPTFFFGSPKSRWTIEYPNEDKYVEDPNATHDDFRKRGFILKVLWLAIDIADTLDGKPLVWPEQFM